MISEPKNWAGNVVFQADRRHRPSSVGELRAVVAGSRSLRALGTGHSFNTLADSRSDLVSVAGLPRLVEIDREARTVTVSAGLRYGDFVRELHVAGFAVPNLASLPHISVAGACATGTHGSGVGNQGLASSVRAFEVCGADGELTTVTRGDASFDGSVVALGMLGVVTRVTLDLVPAFDVRQWVYEGLPHAALRDGDGFDAVMAAAYSVSLFTGWRGDRIDQVWVKHRVDPDGSADARDTPDTPDTWLGARLADGPRHPLPGISAEPCTTQQGVPGPWYDRLPHFRLDFTPSSGDELQSEYFVARADAVAAFDALNGISDRVAPVLQISEVRTIAADDLWLSPAYGRDSVAFHFTWKPDGDAVTPVLGAIEQALAPFEARPHWGKLFTTSPEIVGGRYPRRADFAALAAKSDPEGKFRNDFVERYFPSTS